MRFIGSSGPLAALLLQKEQQEEEEGEEWRSGGR